MSDTSLDTRAVPAQADRAAMTAVEGAHARDVAATARQHAAGNLVRSASAGPARGDDARNRDRAAWLAPKPPLLTYLQYAQQRSGRSPLTLAREFGRLRRSPGRLTFPEYVQYEVYDTSRHTPASQARFITNTLNWPIIFACCDLTWMAVTEDKWLCSRLLQSSAIRVPETVAVIDRSARDYLATPKVASAADLKALLTAPGVLPVFGKQNRGNCSFGAFLVVDADAEGLEMAGHGRMHYDEFLNRFVGEATYILQPVQTNHSFFGRYCDALATVRVCILVDDEDVHIPFAVLKLPAHGTVSDSFWRPGNLACHVDAKSGRILTARTKDALGTTDHDAHPETGEPLVGETVPMWDQVVEMAKRCAPVFSPLPFQSMDIAVTPDGPVVVEVNIGGGFDLPQLASGHGFLTDEVRGFFRRHGYPKV